MILLRTHSLTRLIGRYWILWGLLMLPVFSWADAVYDFSKGQCGVEISGKTSYKDGLLVFGGDGKAILPNSKQFSITDKGLTISMLVRLRPHGKMPGQNLIMKHGEWMVARDSLRGRLYVGLTDGEKYYGAACAGQQVPFGEWGLYTAVYERILQKGQGISGYRQKAYINGELVGTKEMLNVESQHTDNPLVVGYGSGHSVMALEGDVAYIKIWEHSLSDNEIEQEVLKERRIKTNILAAQPISEPFQQAVSALPAFEREALLRAARNGADQQTLIPAIMKMRSGKPQDAIHSIQTGRMKALLLTVGAEKVFPLIGLYDLSTRREILGGHGMNWQLGMTRNGGESRIRSGEFAATVKILSEKQAELIWNCGTVRVNMMLSFYDGRMEADYSVTNLDSQTTLTSATFPHWCLAKMTNGVDKMVIPFMSGIEHAHPTEKQSTIAQQDYFYPSSDLNMQFGAYYDDAGGVYFAHEDPTGAVKRIASAGRRGNLEITYTTAIPRTPENHYQLRGHAVLELFTGNWYEAARIYRRFVDGKADWRIQSLPRLDTPERLRNNTVCIFVQTRFGYTGEMMARDMIKVRDYLELPFIVHWNDWQDIGQGDWPHFFIRPDSRKAIEEFKKHDIDCEVYIDTRLWAEKDAPNREGNLLFDPVGKRSAVRNLQGDDHRERYERWFHEPGSGKGKNKDGWYFHLYEYVIMCPEAPEWQTFIQKLSAQIAGYGVNGIYHDQVMAAQPILCYQTQHGHLPGDPASWVRGYGKMFEPIRGELKQQYPGLWHSSEDVSEPFMKMFDSAFCWRWTHEQVPLFSTVYAGKMQVGYRQYGDAAPSNDINAFYAKTAEQLVRGEQLGYFDQKDLKSPVAMLNVKRMAHLRSGLVSFFNEGELLKNRPYAQPMPIVGTVWSAYKGGSGGGDRVIHTPAVQQGHWRRLRDNAELAVLVNSTAQKQSFAVQQTGKNAQLVTASGVSAYRGERIELAPFESALILDGVSADEAEKLSQLLKKIMSFSEPESFK